MKRIFAVIITAMMLLSAFALGASASYSFEDGETVYEIVTANGVTFSYEGTTSATAFPRGKSTLSCLVDGDAAKGVTAHNQDGIVLVCNDYIKPKYEENVKNSVSPAMTDQAIEDIPNYSFVLEYEETVTFDAIYLSLMHETNACVATPGDNCVTVEYSKNGSDWTPVGTDGIHYYLGCELADYAMNDQSHNTVVEERMVPLTKKVSGKYVRLTFNFMTVPEDNDWRYYTNVYEWVGFTELAVASYESGDKPKPITKEDATVENVKIEGEWIATFEGAVAIYKFADGVYSSNIYLETDYTADPFAAEALLSDSGKYIVFGSKVTLDSDAEDVDDVVFEAVLEDGKLSLDDGIDAVVFEAYVAPEKPDDSSNVESEAESEAASEAESEAVSEAESKEPTESSKKPADESSKSASSSASLDSDKKDEEGSSLGLIIGIIAAVVVVVAVVVVIVLKKKKK